MKQNWVNFNWDSIDFEEQLDIIEKSNTFNFTKKGLTATLTEEFKSFCEFYDIQCGHQYMELMQEYRDEFRNRNLPILLLEDNGYEHTITLHNMDVVLNGKDDDGYPEFKYNFDIIEDDYRTNYEIDNKTIEKIIDENVKINDLPNKILETFNLNYFLAYGNKDIPADHINDLIGDLLDKEIGDKITYKPINNEINKEFILFLSQLINETISNSKNYNDEVHNDLIKNNQKSIFSNVSETLLKTYDDLYKEKQKPNTFKRQR